MTDQQNNYFPIHALPMLLDVSLDASSLFALPLPWGGSGLMGLQGKLADSPHTPTILFAYEMPQSYFFSPKPFSKLDKEQLHVAKYLNDLALHTKTVVYNNVTPGNDPPDFQAEFNGKEVGLDCTQFTIGSRRTANGLFERVRETILRENRRSFMNLQASLVYMFFGRDGSISLPFRKTDKGALVGVIDALKSYTVEVAKTQSPQEPLPSSFHIPYEYTKYECTFYAIPMANAFPNSAFFMFTGFELGLAYTSMHHPNEVIDELKRIIAKHDKPSVEHLLITVGGPNESGIGFPSEELLVDFALTQSFVINQPTYISHIHLHYWSTSKVVELIPTMDIISTGEAYGFSPAYYQALPKAG